MYPSAIFDPPAIIDAVTEEKCTALHGVPTHFLGVLAEVQRRRDDGERVDTRRLRCVRVSRPLLRAVLASTSKLMPAG